MNQMIFKVLPRLCAGLRSLPPLVAQLLQLVHAVAEARRGEEVEGFCGPLHVFAGPGDQRVEVLARSVVPGDVGSLVQAADAVAPYGVYDRIGRGRRVVAGREERALPVPLFCARRGSMPCSMLYRTCFSRRRLLCSMAKRIESVHVSP